MVIKVKIVITLGGWVRIRRGTGGLMGASNVLFLDLMVLTWVCSDYENWFYGIFQSKPFFCCMSKVFQ